MVALSEKDGISIAQIVVYVPAFILSVILSIRHGFGRSAGWYFLVTFTLARLIGAGLQLGTIASPTNISLYAGAISLQNIGLTPLTLLLLALISRVLASIEKTKNLPITSQRLRLVTLVLIAAVVLSAVGGSQSLSNSGTSGSYMPSDLSKAAIALIIVAFVIVTIVTALCALSVQSAERGERRLVPTVAACLPFLLVRIIYSALSVFDNLPAFNLISGSPGVYVGLAVVEEFIVVIIVEAVGLTLQIQPKEPKAKPSGLLGRISHAMNNSNSGPQYERTELDERGQYRN